jgi:hypothetical protein
MIDHPITMINLHRVTTMRKTHPMRSLTTANSAIYARAARNAVSAMTAANVQNAVRGRQITGMHIADPAAITAKTLTMPRLASTLPYCRPQLHYRPVKMMPPKSQRVSHVPAA